MARSGSITSTTRQGIGAVRQGGWLERLTRIGFASKGLVYFLVGLLALMAALGSGGETTGQTGVLQRIAEQPFGAVALAIIAVGLFAYALWRILSSLLDTEGEGSSGKGVAKRIGYFAAGLVYGSVALYAIDLLRGNSAGGGDSTPEWTARLMSMPFGTLLVMLAGVIVIAAGLFQIRDGWKDKFMRKMRLGEMSAAERDAASKAGTLGYMARGIVFAIIGVFLIVAAVRHNPGEARGLEGALDSLASQPLGQFLLAVVALGLMGYGVFCAIAAKYRVVRT